MATAALVGPDTHFILLAGEVSSAESCEGTGTDQSHHSQGAPLQVNPQHVWLVGDNYNAPRIHTCQAFVRQLAPSTAACKTRSPGTEVHTDGHKHK